MGKKFRELRADEIEVRIAEVKEKGVTALIYKTARVDMDILDETVGAENWQDDYKEIKGNLYCGIGIRDSEGKPFVWKWDCGAESRQDGGNEKKGEASDAFKRAGVKWGIGRELYTSPFIFMPVPTVLDDFASKNGKKVFRISQDAKFDSYFVKEIAYENGNIIKIVIVNQKGNVLFTFPKGNSAPKTAPKTNEKGKVGETLTKSELVTVWGVKNAEETISWLERKFGAYYEDWTDEHHSQARALLQAQKQKRENELQKMKEALQEDNEPLPFE